MLAFVLSSFDMTLVVNPCAQYSTIHFYMNASESSDDSSIINVSFQRSVFCRYVCKCRKLKLQYDLVFEASVEVFMWQDDGVEYDDLRWDIYIAAKNCNGGC